MNHETKTKKYQQTHTHATEKPASVQVPLRHSLGQTRARECCPVVSAFVKNELTVNNECNDLTTKAIALSQASVLPLKRKVKRERDRRVKHETKP